MTAPAITDQVAAAAPRRLHGREAELARATAALADAGVRAVVARGPAGVGKTALLQAVLHQARLQGALTGAGKYAQDQGGGSLDPLMAALEAAVTAGLEQLYDPEAGLQDLLRSLGPNREAFAGQGTLLLSVTQGARSRPFTAAEADERLVQATIQTLSWLEGFGQPVLLLIDDWGRAGAQAQRVYRRILGAQQLSRTRLLATERDDEAFPSPPGGVTVIPVGPLARPAQRELTAEMLGARASVADAVLELLGPSADTPFDLIQSVQLLAASNAIAGSRGRWRLDPALAAPALAGTAAESVVRHAAGRDPSALQVARLLAVYGDQAPVRDLSAAAGLPPEAFGRALSALAAAGLVRVEGETVRYAHDRLRAEVLRQLSPARRARLAAAVAETLRRLGVAPVDGARGAVMLLRRCEAGLRGIDRDWWRTALIRGAGEARERGDRETAERFVAAALALTADDEEPGFALSAEAVFAAIARGDHRDAQRRAEAMLRSAGSAAERAAADEMRVFARRMSGDLDGALEAAREVLGRMGVKLPRRPTLAAVAGALVQAVTFDPRKASRPLPPEVLEIEAPLMRATNGIGSLLFERSPLMAVILVTKSIPARVAYGTAAGAASYGLMCCLLGLYRRAARWAEAADRLQGPDQPLRAVAKQYATSFGHVFVRPRTVTRSRGAEMEALAYAGGDLAVAVYGNRDKVLDALFSEDPLEETAALADESIRVAERLNDAPTAPHVRALRQFIENIRVPSPAAARLDGAFFDRAATWAELEANGLGNTARAVATLEALLAVLYARYGEAAALHARPWPQFGSAPFQAQTQIWAFATGLALYRTGGRPSPFGLWNLRRLARLNPADFAHRARLLEAERARSRGRGQAAVRAYARAVAAASMSRCLLEQGLVAAAAAEGCESLGELAAAHAYRDAAITAWRALGAHGLLASRFGEAAAAAAPSPSAPDEQTERELELLAARAAAERTSRAKSRLLATVGHELRTPLQGALGLLELADETARPLDVRSLRNAVAHLAGVVGDLTDLGALEGGVLSVTRAPFDARAAVASVVALHSAAAEAAGRRLAAETSGPPLWVHGDEGRVRQVLGNLLANALRHGQGDVEVRILRPAAGRLAFCVADAGPPLAEAELRRIFEPFERGREREDGGLGVGLFLGRHLARLMGGDLTVDPAPDGGKTFRLEIEAPAAEPPTVAEGGLRGLRVLLAEDNALSRQVLAALLRHEGCEVTEAEDGLQAGERLAAEAFDLVLLDQRMPGRMGAEVARSLAGQAGARPLTVLMSASSDLDAAGLMAAGGVDLVLQKPVSLRALRELSARLPCGGDPTPPGGRLAELKRQLGADGPALLREVRPSVEAEAERLASLAATGDLVGFAEQAHRLRGLARHFGLDRLATALEGAEGADLTEARSRVRRLKKALSQADWRSFEEA